MANFAIHKKQPYGFEWPEEERASDEHKPLWLLKAFSTKVHFIEKYEMKNSNWIWY